MSNFIIICFRIIFFIFVFPLVVKAQSYDRPIRIVTALIESHRRAANVPGSQLTVSMNGHILISKGFGYSDIKNLINVSEDTQFEIGSISKVITAAGIARLYDQGKLNLDSSIQKYLPYFPIKRSTITIRQLLAHTSGIRHYSRNEEEKKFGHYQSVKESLSIFSNDDLIFEPGSRFGYTSYGYNVLGAVIEGVTQQKFNDFVQTEILTPANMSKTCLRTTDRIFENISKSYVKSKKGRSEVKPEDVSYKYPSAGFISTSKDLVAFGNHFINHEFTSPSTFIDFTTPYTFLDGKTGFYSLGFETAVNGNNRKILYHGGNQPHSRSHLIIYPEEKFVLSYLMNTGQSIFFNAREAQILSEVFLDSTYSDVPDSLFGERKAGFSNEDQGLFVIKDSLFAEFRTKHERTEIILIGMKNNMLHGIAVTPMFATITINIMDDKAQSGTFQYKEFRSGEGHPDVHREKQLVFN